MYYINYVKEALPIGNHFYQVGHHFGVSIAIVTMFTIEVCQIFVNNFYNTYVKIPNDETLQEIMKGSENLTGIPYMWGAINGTHIQLSKKPKQQYKPMDYHN